ncbi:MAG: hypothetical protein IIC66_06680 [candidate division Zixibacteria bacterium]|nr:hypothetical protein [candidate division Zixibacteria bacterium]
MKFMKVLSALLLTFLMTAAAGNAADVSFGLSADQDGLKSFYLSVGEHYKAPESEIMVIRKHNIPDDEMPVVFFISRHGDVDAGLVVKLRSEGKSWFEISAHFGLSPEVFYVSFERDPGPPYGKAWGHYKNKKRKDWHKIHLSDGDVVNFVNIKFMSERYGYSPDEIVKMRGKKQGFVNLNAKVKKHKHDKQKKAKLQANSNKPGKTAPAKNKSKGKDKKKGKGKGKP